MQLQPKPHRNAVYETMTRWVGNGYVIRVWMDHPGGD